MDSAIPIVDSLIGVFEAAVGSSVTELDEAVRYVSDGEPDRVRVAGFVKLLRDLCEVDTAADVDPVELRAEVFASASEARKNLGVRDEFDRESVLTQCAAARGVSSARIQELMFADLPGAQVIRSMSPVTAEDLLHRYNLALAQGVLLRATRVTIILEPTTAPRLRQLLGAIKFRRLMYRISGSSDEGYEIELDGPMSLFESTHRYGMQLALFLPVLVAGDGWNLEAQLRWGKDRRDAVFCMDDCEGHVSHYVHEANELEEIGQLVDTFSRQASGWEVSRTSRIFIIKGETVFVPDLLFTKTGTEHRVYLEAFGYWNRDAVFDRVEVLRRNLGERFILAVSKKLRVSPDVACDGFPGRIVVYGGSISAASVRRALDEIVGEG